MSDRAFKPFHRPCGAELRGEPVFHGFHFARRSAGCASPVATVRRPVGAKRPFGATGHLAFAPIPAHKRQFAPIGGLSRSWLGRFVAESLRPPTIPRRRLNARPIFLLFVHRFGQKRSGSGSRGVTQPDPADPDPNLRFYRARPRIQHRRTRSLHTHLAFLHVKPGWEVRLNLGGCLET
jgi:hypothetical protein